MATTATSGVVETQPPAIWPAAGVTIDSPDQVAAEFVTEVLGVEPVLGDFKQGDSRSGEIEVFSPGEGAAATAASRGILLLRQLGDGTGWFIIGAVNEHASITSPASGAVVAAGPLTVEGVARGQEANVVVTAFVAGDAKSVLDSKITMGGAMETALPYSVALDLSKATPGEVVALLVRGGAGLETDPGEFSAIPVVIVG
ncbi:MAG: Gmad2 immunoglobulin-like domain-containing protein [Ilumatobacteraceae bacterium]